MTGRLRNGDRVLAPAGLATVVTATAVVDELDPGGWVVVAYDDGQLRLVRRDRLEFVARQLNLESNHTEEEGTMGDTEPDPTPDPKPDDDDGNGDGNGDEES